MVLPTIIRTTEEAISAVPQDYREVSYTLGITHWQTVTRVVLPSAAAGHYHRHHAEHRPHHQGDARSCCSPPAPLLRTPLSVFDSGRTMAVHFYILAREGISMPNAYATAAVLVISILAINLIAYSLMQRMMKRFS